MRKLYGRLAGVAEARSSGGRPAARRAMRLTTGLALVMTVVTGLLGSCATAPASREDKAALVAEATSRWQQMRTADPALGALVQARHGYACFPMWGRRASAWAGPTGEGWCTSGASTSATLT